MLETWFSSALWSHSTLGWPMRRRWPSAASIVTCRPRCWSPASTSSSSGWRG
ncbi:hypothetical protein [Chiayiivirga sp.]|uniref:hypothetical protein n=1 Tax=Chiayiivirga sp. TaxID=2041042 RepID=UPI003DA99484